MSGCASSHINNDGIYLFDARGVAKRFRHAAIFGALDALVPGETMRFTNDHNPLPLLAQLHAKYGESLEVSYVSDSTGSVIIDFMKH